MYVSTSRTELAQLITAACENRRRIWLCSMPMAVFGSRNQAKDHRLRTVQRSCSKCRV